MAWYDSSWSNRLAVTVDYTKVNADLTDFPVYLDLGQIGSGHGFWTNVQTDGDDIRITKSDETTEVPVEIVSIDTTGKTGEVHFLADGTLSSTVDTVYYVYYGNGGASRPAVSATYGRDAVWAAYDAVWHLGESSGSAVDSTGNGNTGTFNGNLPNETAVQLGDGQDADGTGDYVDVGTLAGWHTSTSRTFQAWLEYTDTSGWVSIFGYIVSGVSDDIDIDLNRNTSGGVLAGSPRVYYADDDGNTNGFAAESAGLHTGGPHLFVLTHNGSDIKPVMYVDGAAETVTAYDGTTFGQLSNIQNYSTPNDSYYLGARNLNNGTANREYTGAFEEVRLRSDKISAGWAATEYNNQNAPSTFYAIGAEEDAPSAGGVSSLIIID